MNWSETARIVIARGAPVLGAALGGPLGGAAGEILANALGVPAGSPTDVGRALGEPGATANLPALAEAELRWIELVRAEAEAAREAVGATHETIRAEMAAQDWIQRWWRPAYALELTLECALLWTTITYGFWRGEVATFNALTGGAGLAIAYWGFRFGVLGIYVNGRTREKLSILGAGRAAVR